MTNPFSGIINSRFKQLFVDAISSLLYDDACTIPCVLSYGVTKYEDCINCNYSYVGNKSSNTYQSGGPIPFPNGVICPMCNGDGKKPIETTEDINLVVIWDSKNFIDSNTVNDPVGIIETITFIENTPKLKRAKEIIVAKDISNFGRHRYERISDPQPCGMGASSFVSCKWKKAG